MNEFGSKEEKTDTEKYLFMNMSIVTATIN
jgi:hypothetical protein